MPTDEQLIKQMHERVSKIEDGHNELSQVMRDFQKDFHLKMNKVGELKAFLKKISHTSTDMALFKQRYETHREETEATNKRIFQQIDEVKKNQTRVAWLIITAVGIALMKTIIVNN